MQIKINKANVYSNTVFLQKVLKELNKNFYETKINTIIFSRVFLRTYFLQHWLSVWYANGSSTQVDCNQFHTSYSCTSAVSTNFNLPLAVDAFFLTSNAVSNIKIFQRGTFNFERFIHFDIKKHIYLMMCSFFG